MQPATAPGAAASALVVEPPGSPVRAAMPLAIAGFFIGGLVGFVMRPSALLIGQLPFGVVITRGAGLTGFDTLLRPTAETSFNQMAMAAVLGAVAGAFIGVLMRVLPARRG